MSRGSKRRLFAGSPVHLGLLVGMGSDNGPSAGNQQERLADAKILRDFTPSPEVEQDRHRLCSGDHGRRRMDQRKPVRWLWKGPRFEYRGLQLQSRPNGLVQGTVRRNRSREELEVQSVVKARQFRVAALHRGHRLVPEAGYAFHDHQASPGSTRHHLSILDRTEVGSREEAKNRHIDSEGESGMIKSAPVAIREDWRGHAICKSGAQSQGSACDARVAEGHPSVHRYCGRH